jgi:hypothetical protein
MYGKEEDISRHRIQIHENPDRLGQEKDVIEEYGALFNPSALDTLTKEEFKSFLLFRNNHHWDGIHRQQNAITSDMGRLKTALKILLDESIPIKDRLEFLFPIDRENYIKGLDKATATPILLVVYPTIYGVWNARSEEGLRNLGLINKFKSNQTFADRYLEINRQLHYLAQKYKVSLWQLDEIVGWIMYGNQPIAASDVSAPRNKL